MTKSIDFPNLGIHLKNVGQSVSIFGLDIAYYGIVIAAGIILGFIVMLREAKRTGQNPETYYDITIFGVLAALIGARLYYVIFSWDDYKDDPLSIFNIREGGLAIYGAVIAVVLTVFIYSKVKKIPFTLIMDTGIPSLILGQAVGRWGNFFNREAFGEYTNSLFAMRLPVDAVRASDITEKMLRHIEVIDGIRYIRVHPTFLYESVWNLAVFFFLMWWRKHKKFNGELLFMYFLGYGLGRFWIEGLRTDQLLIFHAVPVSQLLSAVLAVGSAAAIIVLRRRAGKKKEPESASDPA